jgi:hypothetical protein
MTSIFISYRRDDASGHAGRLFDRLVARFGADHVFMDVSDIQPGQNFEQAIERTLARCDHLLAVVGPQWLSILTARETIGDDFVRNEIAAALSRGTTVIPVLVGGAEMPTGAQLPAELAAFAKRQAVTIHDHVFDEDAARLVKFLAGGTDSAETPRLGRRMRRPALWASLALAASAIAGAWWLWPSRGSEEMVTPGAVPAAVTPVATAPAAAPAAAPVAAAPAAGPTPSEPDVDGDWIAEMQKPGQPLFRIRMTLARSGSEVIGTVTYPTGQATILDGEYADGRMTFHTSHVPQFESVPATIRFQARVNGDVITLTTADDGGVATGSARRVAAMQSQPR